MSMQDHFARATRIWAGLPLPAKIAGGVLGLVALVVLVRAGGRLGGGDVPSCADSRSDIIRTIEESPAGKAAGIKVFDLVDVADQSEKLFVMGLHTSAFADLDQEQARLQTRTVMAPKETDGKAWEQRRQQIEQEQDRLDRQDQQQLDQQLAPARDQLQQLQADKARLDQQHDQLVQQAQQDEQDFARQEQQWKDQYLKASVANPSNTKPSPEMERLQQQRPDAAQHNRLAQAQTQRIAELQAERERQNGQVAQLAHQIETQTETQQQTMKQRRQQALDDAYGRWNREVEAERSTQVQAFEAEYKERDAAFAKDDDEHRRQYQAAQRAAYKNGTFKLECTATALTNAGRRPILATESLENGQIYIEVN